MSLRDIIERDASEELRVALAAAGACLTDRQIDLLAESFAGQSAATIRAALAAVLPPIEERVGVHLPVLAPGRARDFPTTVGALVLIVGAAMERFSLEDFSNAVDEMGFDDARAQAMASQNWGGVSYPGVLNGVTPALAFRRYLAIGPGHLWNFLGLTPGAIERGGEGPRAPREQGRDGARPDGGALRRGPHPAGGDRCRLGRSAGRARRDGAREEVTLRLPRHTARQHAIVAAPARPGVSGRPARPAEPRRGDQCSPMSI